MNKDKLINIQQQLNDEIERQMNVLEAKQKELDKREEEWKQNCNKLEKVFIGDI